MIIADISNALWDRHCYSLNYVKYLGSKLWSLLFITPISFISQECNPLLRRLSKVTFKEKSQWKELSSFDWAYNCFLQGYSCLLDEFFFQSKRHLYMHIYVYKSTTAVLKNSLSLNPNHHTCAAKLQYSIQFTCLHCIIIMLDWLRF